MHDQPVQSVEARLEALEQQLAAMTMRAERAERRGKTKRWLALGLVAFLALVPVAFAATGNCPNGLPVCFTPDTPALASDVNQNFAQLKEWLETKVGLATETTVSSSAVRVQTGTTSNAALASGKSLVVTGAYGDGASGNGGVEFRHDNQTQGIGFGYNTIYATGSAADQSLQLKGRGTGTIELLSNTRVGTLSATSLTASSLTAGNLTVTGTISETTSCRTGVTQCQPDGAGNMVFLDRTADLYCNVGEYLRGFQFFRCNNNQGYLFNYSCCSF